MSLPGMSALKGICRGKYPSPRMVDHIRLGIGNTVNKDLARAKESSEKINKQTTMSRAQGEF